MAKESHAKEEDESRKFTSVEFLSPQQIKSYFSRASAKLRQSGISDDDDESDAQAAAEQAEYSDLPSVRTLSKNITLFIQSCMMHTISVTCMKLVN